MAQAFGRFGYSPFPAVPGWTLDAEGIRANFPSADKLTFPMALKKWQPVETSDLRQVSLTGGGAGSPSKVRASLLSFGVSMYFEAGVALGLTSTASPYLSWAEGTVEDGVPTPNAKWVLVSFRDRQPPILLVFGGEAPGLVIQGKPGAWTLKTPGVYKGWVRFCLPRGTEAAEANSAAGLGKLVKAVEANEDLWVRGDPEVTKTTVQEEWTAVTGDFLYSAAGVPVPSPVDLAPLGGYPVKALTKIRKLDFTLDGQSVFVTAERSLKIRFPVKRVPTGRGLAVGKRAQEPLGTVSSLDLPSVAELALENLLGTRDRRLRETGERAMAEFVQAASSSREPWTKQTMLYGEDGAGIDLAASHALLMQALAAINQASSEANSLLTSITWRRDWLSWRLWGVDAVKARRAAALASLAGALCPEPERRLEAAILQAGLAAERGAAIRRARATQTEAPVFLEPMDALRQSLFGSVIPPAAEDPFLKVLLSEIRAYGDAALELASTEERVYVAAWEAKDTLAATLTLAAGYPIQVENLNLDKFEVAQGLGFTKMTVRPKAPGRCEIRIRIPAWAKLLPVFVEPSAYSETSR